MAEVQLNRRELLAGLLGAAACTRLESSKKIAGAIVGPNVELGHKLRDGLLPTAHSIRDVPVVIVGGGISGLSAAWRLTRAGFHDFELIELDEAPGGTSRGADGPICPVPWGAHYVPCPLPHATAMVELLSEIGAVSRRPDGSLEFDETQLCRAPQERIYSGGRFWEGLWPRAAATSADDAQHAAFQAEVRQLAGLHDAAGRRAFAVPVDHGADTDATAALDRQSMASWLDRRNYGSPALRWWIEYATRDDFGASLGQTSAWAALHYFAARQQDGRSQELLTWPGGNSHLARHLAKVAGKAVRTGVAATRIELIPGVNAARRTPAALVHTFEPRTGRSEALRAARVIVATPRAFAARLLSDEQTRLEASLFPTGSWLVVNLTLKSAPASAGFPQAWDNVIHGSASLGYVVATHQLDRPPRGPQAWTWYLPLIDDDPAAARRKLLALTHEEICALVLADLRRPHPDIADHIERIDAWKWGHAMVRPVPGLHSSAARAAAARPRGVLHWAHTELSGMALFEEAQHHGVRAADEVLAALA